MARIASFGLVALMMGCGKGGWADVSGTIGTVPFDSVETVFQGNGYVVLFDRKIDCLDASFVKPVYVDGQAPTEIEFNALQFYYDDQEIVIGTYDFSGADSPVSAIGLLNVGAFEGHRARAGSFTVTEAGNDWVVGGFNAVEFTTGSVSGKFEAQFCRNLRT